MDDEQPRRRRPAEIIYFNLLLTFFTIGFDWYSRLDKLLFAFPSARNSFWFWRSPRPLSLSLAQLECDIFFHSRLLKICTTNLRQELFVITDATLSLATDTMMIHLFLSCCFFFPSLVDSKLMRWSLVSGRVWRTTRVERTALSLERLIERVGAFIYGIYVKLINESYFPFHRQQDTRSSWWLYQNLYWLLVGFRTFSHSKFVMRGQIVITVQWKVHQNVVIKSSAAKNIYLK